MTRLLAALALAALALLAGGCALLPGTSGAAGEDRPAGPPPPPAVVLEVQAPSELRVLLERYLDLARIGALANGEPLSEAELSRLIDAAPTQVRELLQTEGYFSPELRIERVPAPPGGGPQRVRLTLQPGPQTVVGRVNLEVEGALAQAIEAGDAEAQRTLDRLRNNWALRSGTAFRNAAWSDAKSAALAQLRAAGYAAATWSGTALDIDAPAASARVFVVADSGPLFRTGDVRIEGLQLQDRETVLNLAAFPRGTPATETLLLDFQDRLQKSGLFERVLVTLDPDPANAASARIDVRLGELPLHQLTLGVGYSANSGPRATGEHIYRRVLGYPATARNKVEWGTARQAWDGELSTHPSEGLYRNLVGVTIERLVTSEDTVLSQRMRLGRTQDSQRIERFYFGQFDRASRRTAGGDRSDAIAYSLNYNWSWRDIDNPLLPTRGITVALEGGVGQAHDGTGLSGGFGRAYGRVTGYLPLGDKWYSQARIELGEVFTREDLIVPDTLRFRAGGDDSVRGYAYRSLGPTADGAVEGGRSLFTASIELARPFVASMPQLWGAVFLDAGNAANTFADLKPVYGVGVGLRWRSPVGPLRLDLAYGTEVRRVRAHFSVGIVF